MKLHVKVLIVGGGVVGASIAYHLQKGGWKDIVLIERDELLLDLPGMLQDFFPYLICLMQQAIFMITLLNFIKN